MRKEGRRKRKMGSKKGRWAKMERGFLGVGGHEVGWW
jgi:hypothetical protein